MTGGRWLAEQTREIMQAREGDPSTVAPIETDTASPTAPSRYPMMWQLEPGELVGLATIAGWSVAELVEHAARRPLLR